MAFDGLFTSKMVEELKLLEQGRINKIYQSSKYDYIFTIRANYQNYNLLISSNPEASRIQITKKSYENMQTPPMFCMLLRKHLDGGIIKSINQYKTDRVITISIDSVNELGFMSTKYLIVEVMGRHSNIILTDNDFKIIDSIKRISPFENINRTIIPTSIYQYPSDNKLNTLELDSYNKSNLSNYQGLSKLVINHLNNSNSSLESIINSYNPCIIESNKKIFYFTDLSYYIGNRIHFKTLSDLLDYFYYDECLKERIKQQTSNINGFIKKEIEKYENKINKLTLELNNAHECEIFKIKGELIMANLYKIKSGSTKINVLNYYDNTYIDISLDPLLDPVKNSNRYYTKYRKMKNSIVHLEEQIKIATDELEYFYLLKSQLEISSINDALEIKDELILNGYLKEDKKKQKKKKVSILTYKIDDNYIYVGKNNIQNDYLTNKFANPNDLWFHVKDAPGSHVVLRGEVCEKTIRACAMVASFYSKYRNSSSVAVDYTLVKNVKKIPGMKNCFVRIYNQKTIYIDPSEEFINTLQIV